MRERGEFEWSARGKARATCTEITHRLGTSEMSQTKLSHTGIAEKGEPKDTLDVGLALVASRRGCGRESQRIVGGLSRGVARRLAASASPTCWLRLLLLGAKNKKAASRDAAFEFFPVSRPKSEVYSFGASLRGRRSERFSVRSP